MTSRNTKKSYKVELCITPAKKACMLCGKLHEAELVIEARPMTNKPRSPMPPSGWLEGPCKGCQQEMKKGIVLVALDERRSDVSKPQHEWYRTGGRWVVRPDLLKTFLQEPAISQALKARCMFIPDELAAKMGLYKKLKKQEA